MFNSPYQGPLVAAPAPTPCLTPRLDIVRPPQGGSVQGVLLSQHITGFNVHYRDRLSIPCCLNPHFCPGCSEKMPWKWYGFLIGLQQPSHKVVIFELTVGAWNKSQRLREENGQLRGYGLRLTRDRGSKRGKVTAELTGERARYELPVEPCLSKALARIWGIDPELADLRYLGTPSSAQTAASSAPAPCPQPCKQCAKDGPPADR